MATRPLSRARHHRGDGASPLRGTPGHKAHAKRYTDTDVLTAAQARIASIFDACDTPVVMMSGGKDSLVVLHLAWAEASRRGMPTIPAVYLDKEHVPDVVHGLVLAYRDAPWVALRWCCYWTEATKYLLGHTYPHEEWPPDREHFRPMPPFAVTHPARLAPPAYLAHALSPYRGKIIKILGCRADESRNRAAAIFGAYRWRFRGELPHFDNAWPIYDWAENDVLYYLHTNGIRWSALYEWQHHAGTELRVSTPFNSVRAKHAHEHLRTDPAYYRRLLDLFPDFAVQVRYGPDFDASRPALTERYAAQGWRGVYHAVRDYVHVPAERRKLLARLRSIERDDRPEYYPIEWLVQQIVNGVSHGDLLPIKEAMRERYASKARARGWATVVP